jgi:hypothetical protein
MSLLRFKALTFEVVGTTIASPCCRATPLEIKPVKPDWHFSTLDELADAAEAEAAQQRRRRASRLFGVSLATDSA